MTKNEYTILKAVVDRGGLLSPADLINGIAQRDNRSVENLVARKYLEEVPRQHRGLGDAYYTINFYRATEKGLLVFSPWYKKVWASLRGDVRTIVISAVTALITTLIAIFVQKFFQ